MYDLIMIHKSGTQSQYLLSSFAAESFGFSIAIFAQLEIETFLTGLICKIAAVGLN